jgi:hypothetical protein
MRAQMLMQIAIEWTFDIRYLIFGKAQGMSGPYLQTGYHLLPAYCRPNPVNRPNIKYQTSNIGRRPS